MADLQALLPQYSTQLNNPRIPAPQESGSQHGDDESGSDSSSLSGSVKQRAMGSNALGEDPGVWSLGLGMEGGFKETHCYCCRHNEVIMIGKLGFSRLFIVHSARCKPALQFASCLLHN